MNKTIARIIEKIYNILHSEEFKEKYRMQDKDFTRKRKLSFPEICLMILKGSKKGLQAAINTFLKETKNQIKEYSNAAFCKARQKINPDAFKHLFKIVAKEFYSNNEYKTFLGYRVWAIDGSKLNLPNTEELLEVYGSENFNNGIHIQAQVSCLYDVLNHVILDAYMEPHNTSERTLAKKHFECLKAFNSQKELLLMDRGYPSEDILLTLENSGLNYVIRTNKNEFFKEVRNVKTEDEIIERKCKNGNLKIRVVTFKLNNGNEETILTNIMDAKITKENFADIYRLRWGIETKYDDIKNKLELENFSGVTGISVLQDFYSTMFLSNLLAALEFECSDELEIKNSSKELKYQYKINTSHAISTLKTSVVELLLTDSKRKTKKILKNIHMQLLQCLVPIRNNRSFPRTRKRSVIKFRSNKKQL